MDDSGGQAVGGNNSVGMVTGFGGDRSAGIVTLRPGLGLLGLVFCLDEGPTTGQGKGKGAD